MKDMTIKLNANVILVAIVVAILAYLPFHLTKDIRGGGSIEQTIENYIKNNPKVIDDTMKAFYEGGGSGAGAGAGAGAAAAPQAPDRSKAINENKAELNSLENAVIMANPNGKINMIEFTDSNCPFCKRNVATMEKISKENSNVRWIIKPVTAMGGVDSAKALYAANKQGVAKVKALHDAIYASEARVDKAVALKLAGDVGIDVKRLEADMESEEVKKQIDAGVALFQKLGGGGVPSIVIGESFIEGAYPEEEFLKAIEKAK